MRHKGFCSAAVDSHRYCAIDAHATGRDRRSESRRMVIHKALHGGAFCACPNQRRFLYCGIGRAVKAGYRNASRHANRASARRQGGGDNVLEIADRLNGELFHAGGIGRACIAHIVKRSAQERPDIGAYVDNSHRHAHACRTAAQGEGYSMDRQVVDCFARFVCDSAIRKGLRTALSRCDGLGTIRGADRQLAGGMDGRSLVDVRADVAVQNRNSNARAHARCAAAANRGSNQAGNQIVVCPHVDIALAEDLAVLGNIGCCGIGKRDSWYICEESGRPIAVRIAGIERIAIALVDIAAGIARRAIVGHGTILGMANRGIAVTLPVGGKIVLQGHRAVGRVVGLRCQGRSAAKPILTARAIKEGIRIERIHDRIMRILIQLTAHHRRHHNSANTGCAARAKGADIGGDIPLAICQHIQRAIGFDGVVIVDSGCYRVLRYGHNGCYANAGRPCRCRGGCYAEETVFVLCVNQNAARDDIAAFVRIDPCFLGMIRFFDQCPCGQLGHDHIHRARYGRHAAAGKPRAVRRDKFLGMSQHGKRATALDVGRRKDQRLGRSAQIGDNGNAAHASRAASRRRQSDVVEPCVAACRYGHAAICKCAAAKPCRHKIFKHKHIAACGHRCACAAHTGCNSQQVKLILAVCGDGDILLRTVACLSCLVCSAARQDLGDDLFIKDQRDNGRAYRNVGT